MKILFIYSGAENLGVEYLSSFLKSHGHETSLLFDPALFSSAVLVQSNFLSKFFDKDDEIIEKVIAAKPDLVAFSCITATYKWSLNLAKRIWQQSNIPLVFGGIHVTSVPEEVMQHNFIDYAIVGEGEYALLELLEYLSGDNNRMLSGIQNLVYRDVDGLHFNQVRNYIQDIDSLPFPDKDLFYGKIPLLSETYLVLTSRGCPFACTYCCNNIYHNLYAHQKHTRRRSPENVIAELKLAKEKWSPKIITFTDDVFSTSTSWLEDFIPLYKKEIGIPFSCLTHPANLSKRAAELLKDGGCCLILIGIQTGSERMRRDIFNRNESNEKILESIRYVRDAGISLFSVDIILGGPTETEEDMEKSLDLCRRIAPDRILTFWLSYYPNTEIIKIAEHAGDLSKADILKINEGHTQSPHSGGSVSKAKRKLYLKYETELQLLCLIQNEKFRSLFATIISYLPFRIFNQGLMFLIAIKNNDPHVFNYIRYYWTKKTVP